MTQANHNQIRESLRRRIASGEWPPGSHLPVEIDLAGEYNCARATINRALQSLVADGLIERRRRAGTRVKELPSPNAKISISIVRHEVEAREAEYRPHVILNEIVDAPHFVSTRLRMSARGKVLHLQTIHMADERAYAFEDRWVNLKAVPGIIEAPFDEISANEWLVREMPYSSGDVIFTARNADSKIAEALDTHEGAALFTIERTTWLNEDFITTTTLYYPPGYRLKSSL